MRKITALVSALLLALLLFVGCSGDSGTANTADVNIDTQNPDIAACNDLLPADLTSIVQSSPLSGEAFIQTYSDKQEAVSSETTTAVDEDEEKERFAGDFLVEINYPQFRNMDSPEMEEKINALVENMVTGFVEDHRIDNTKIDLRVNGEVTLFSENLISMVFRGNYNFEFAAHPANIIFTLNLVPSATESFILTDYITFDENFLNALVKMPLDDSSPENIEAIAQSLTDADFKADAINRLSNIDLENSSAYSYYTPNSVVIILPVAHVYGDYMEYVIPC